MPCETVSLGSLNWSSVPARKRTAGTLTLAQLMDGLSRHQWRIPNVFTIRSVGRYVCAFGEAIAAMLSRCYEFGAGDFLIAVILFSRSLFQPMAYNTLEYVSFRSVGLFLLLLLINTQNVAFSWTEHCAVISLTIAGRPIVNYSKTTKLLTAGHVLTKKCQKVMNVPVLLTFCVASGPSPSVLFAEDDERLVGEIVPHPGMQLVFQTTVRWVLPLAMLLQTLPPFFVVPTEPWTWLRYCPSPST
ncbi:hypothetical protein L917_03176 [Phytophthora nicotianae]|uniref:Uncharacterized protein n=1 Tax=Phytophthora nicotianae TaxID=4792 RepID=W2LRK4_PHYNI|nr:hypothetical protein L917_03176 [Phytophthora nicotianae]